MIKKISYRKWFVLLLATILSLTAWVVLWNLEKSGEIEGPVLYVNGVLWMSLFFSVPFSWAMYNLVQRKVALTRLIIKVPTFGLCLLFSFVLLASVFFLVSGSTFDLLDRLFPAASR